jgi:DMSO reductase anchor subunit
MTINWELVLATAFCAVGIIEWLKGFAKDGKPGLWRWLLPVICLVIGAVALMLPAWVLVGILALALSQIGYEVIIEAVKKRIK